MLKFFLLLLLLSCSSPPPKKGSTKAEILYHQAKELMEQKRYILATEKFNLIRSKYPYSYYATHAELHNANILFIQENFVGAASAYLVFKDFHPKHSQMAFVIYRIAESFFHQIPSTYDRDLTPAFEAIKYYKYLKYNYPKSKHNEDGQKRMEHCREMIQNKERYIADFYFKTDDFSAARHRYLSILDNFGQNEMIRDWAIIRVISSSHALDDKKGCKTYYKKYKGLIKPVLLADLTKAYNSCLN